MKYIILYIGMFIFVACGGEKKQIANRQQLYGKWYIMEASRNGKKTNTLKDGYLTFLENGKLETNILGSPVSADFKFEGDRLICYGNFEYDFVVTNLTKDSLVLSGKMKIFDMVFYMGKTPPQDVLIDGVIKDVDLNETRELN